MCKDYIKYKDTPSITLSLHVYLSIKLDENKKPKLIDTYEAQIHNRN